MKPTVLFAILLLVIGSFATGWLSSNAARPGISAGGAQHPLPSVAPALDQTNPALSKIRVEVSVAISEAAAVLSIHVLASRDLQAALAKVEATPYLQRRALLMGIFAYVAKNRSPEEALRLAMEQKGPNQEIALLAMLQAWTGDTNPLATSSRGFLVAASYRLFEGGKTSPDVAAAWLAAFSKDAGRAEISATYATAYLMQSPDQLLPMIQTFTPWEKSHFLDHVLSVWAWEAPALVNQLVQSHAFEIPPALRRKALQQWAAAEPEKARTEFESMTDPILRKEMLSAVAASLGLKDTVAAVAWADSLSNPIEQETAHTAIYDAVPRGIGAALFMKDGFTYIANLLPGGAAEQAGLLPQDRLLEVTGSDGEAHSLFNVKLEDAVKNVRGNELDTLQIRVLRKEDSGETTELILPVTRRQLVSKPQ